MSYKNTMDPVIHLTLTKLLLPILLVSERPLLAVILVYPLPAPYQQRCLKVQGIILVKNLSHFVPTYVIFGCVPLGWCGSGSVIQDHSDLSSSKEPMNPWPEWIRRFLWCTMIQVILDHWSWFRSPQRNAPFIGMKTFSYNSYVPTSWWILTLLSVLSES